MSGLFGLDVTGNQALREEAALNPILPDQVHPGFFAGIPGTLARAIPQAAGIAAKGVELAGAVPTGIVGALLAPQVDVPQKYFETFDPAVKGWNDYFAPNPRETGTAARVLGGFAQSAALLAAGAGNPTLLIAGTGLSGAMELSDQGVSPDVAAAGGTLQASAAALGFKVPFLGKTLPMRVATGAAGFAATNVATVEAQKQLLLATGYSNLAAAYEPFNGTDRAIDLLVGGLFGTLHHFGAGGEPITAESRDAALTLANARHLAIDAAPGFPADVATSAIHQQTIEQAMGQLLRDEPVTPPATLAEATFEPKPATMQPADIPADLKALDQTLRGELVTAQEAVQNALFATRQQSAAPEPAALVGLGRIADPQLSAELVRMKDEAGWAEVGGRMIRKSEDPGSIDYSTVTGRTPWVPRADWWPERPGRYNEAETRRIVDMALAGKKLGPKQEELVNFMLDVAHERNQLPEFMPTPDELKGAGLSTVDEAHEAAYVAKAVAIDEAAVERLAIQHEDRVGFLRAVKEFIDGHESAVAPGRQAGAGATEGGQAGTAAPTGGGQSAVESQGGRTDQLGQGRGEKLEPAVQTATDLIAQTPDLHVATGNINADGTAETVSAAEAMARTHQDIADAEANAKAFGAAVNCAAQRGTQ